MFMLPQVVAIKGFSGENGIFSAKKKVELKVED